MLRREIVVAALVVLVGCRASLSSANPAQRLLSDRGKVVAQADRNAQDKQRRPQDTPASVDKERSKSSDAGSRQPDENVEINRRLADYTGQLAVFTKWLVGVTVSLGVIASIQIIAIIYIAVQQLRAYVVVFAGQIHNVANPLPPPAGQVAPLPTFAALTNPTIGPVAVLTTKNTGLTPAHDVKTWANIIIRAFPLNAALPEEPPG